MPRNVLLSVERTLVDAVAPGARISVVAIASLFNSGARERLGAAAIRTPFLRVLGLEVI